MIVTCPRCQTRYELADDAIRGKVLRGACKNCGCALTLNDSSPFSSQRPSAPRSSPAASFGTFAPAASVLRPPANDEDDETRMLPRFNADVSVHEEQTKIGSIPVEALNAEKLFAQRTEPPPPAGGAAQPPKSLNELVEQANSGTEPTSDSTIPKLPSAPEIAVGSASVEPSAAPSDSALVAEYSIASDSAIESLPPLASNSASEPPEVPSDSAIESLPLLAADETTTPLEMTDALGPSTDDVVRSAVPPGGEAPSPSPARQRSRNGWLVVGLVALLVGVLVVWFSGWGAHY